MIRVNAGEGLSTVIPVHSGSMWSMWSGGGQLDSGKCPRKGKPRQRDSCSPFSLVTHDCGTDRRISQKVGQLVSQLIVLHTACGPSSGCHGHSNEQTAPYPMCPPRAHILFGRQSEPEMDKEIQKHRAQLSQLWGQRTTTTKKHVWKAGAPPSEYYEG